jgi:biopolymer transport protein ExbD
VIEDLMNKPDSVIKQQQVEAAIASHLEDKPEDEVHLKAMHEQLQGKVKTDNSIVIKGDGNKVYQNINNSTITDHSISQTHSGTGDIVGRDKITGK